MPALEPGIRGKAAGRWCGRPRQGRARESSRVAPPEQEGDRPVSRGLLLKGPVCVCVRALGHALTEVSIERACSSTHVSGKRSSEPTCSSQIPIRVCRESREVLLVPVSSVRPSQERVLLVPREHFSSLQVGGPVKCGWPLQENEIPTHETEQQILPIPCHLSLSLTLPPRTLSRPCL